MSSERTAEFRARLVAALDARRGLVERGDCDAFRAFHGAADGIPGLYLDVWGPGATLTRYVDAGQQHADAPAGARAALETLAPLGVRAVYDKPFVRDRSRAQGPEDPVLSEPTPIAGEELPRAITVREPSGLFEVRLHDGFSTGLFLDQRETRARLRALCNERRLGRVLNLFAYTGAFSVACALGGAEASTVDVSGRYLDCAKRNFALNGIDPEEHHFARMDARAFLDLAERKGFRFDLVVCDPPTFGAANRKRRIPAWSSVKDYPDLLRRARKALAPGGLIYASVNTAALCEPAVFDRMIRDALGPGLEFLGLPERQVDFPPGDRFPARALVAPRS